MEVAATHSLGAGHQADTGRAGSDHLFGKRGGRSISEEVTDPEIERDDGRME
ncbi:MAG: hypothetical protein NVS9B14_16710 [Candidatus Acidiferrum sp.]